MNLKIIGCIEEASVHAIIATDTLGLSFKLLKLDPYPDTTNMPVPFNSYNAKLQITKLLKNEDHTFNFMDGSFIIKQVGGTSGVLKDVIYNWGFAKLPKYIF